MKYDPNNPNNKQKPTGYKPWKNTKHEKPDVDPKPNDAEATKYKTKQVRKTPFGNLPFSDD